MTTPPVIPRQNLQPPTFPSQIPPAGRPGQIPCQVQIPGQPQIPQISQPQIQIPNQPQIPQISQPQIQIPSQSQIPQISQPQIQIPSQAQIPSHPTSCRPLDPNNTQKPDKPIKTKPKKNGRHSTLQTVNAISLSDENEPPPPYEPTERYENVSDRKITRDDNFDDENPYGFRDHINDQSDEN